MHHQNVEPLENFAFRVLWDGQQIAGVSKVSPLIRITDVVTFREGSAPGQLRKFPQSTDYAPIVIDRGISADTAFEQWSNLVMQTSSGTGGNFHKDITIEVLNEAGQLVLRYKVFKCWPSEYQALPQLNASEDLIAVERLTLQNEGWQRFAST